MFKNSFLKKLFFMATVLSIASTCVVFGGKHTDAAVVKKTSSSKKTKEEVLLKVVAGCIASSPEDRVRFERLLRFQLNRQQPQRSDVDSTPSVALVASGAYEEAVARVSRDEVSHDMEHDMEMGEVEASSSAVDSQDHVTVGDELEFVTIAIAELERQKTSDKVDGIDSVIEAFKNVKVQLAALDSSLLVTNVSILPVTPAIEPLPVVPAILPDIRIGMPLPPGPAPTPVRPSFFRRHMVKITIGFAVAAAIVVYIFVPWAKDSVDSAFGSVKDCVGSSAGSARDYVGSAAGSAKDFVCSAASSTWSGVRGFCSYVNELLHAPQRLAALEAQNAELRRVAGSCVTGERLEALRKDLSNSLSPYNIAGTCSSAAGSCVTEEGLSRILTAYVKTESFDSLVMDSFKKMLISGNVASGTINDVMKKVAEEAVKTGSLKTVITDILGMPGVSFAVKVLKWVFKK